MANAGGQAERGADFIAEFDVGCVVLRLQIVVDRAEEGGYALQRTDQVVGIGLLMGRYTLAQVIEARDADQRPGVEIELELLADLVLIDANEDVADFKLSSVNIDEVVRREL